MMIEVKTSDRKQTHNPTIKALLAKTLKDFLQLQKQKDATAKSFQCDDSSKTVAKENPLQAANKGNVLVPLNHQASTLARSSHQGQESSKAVTTDNEARGNLQQNLPYPELSDDERQDCILTLVIITSLIDKSKASSTCDSAVSQTLVSVQTGLAKLMKLNETRFQMYNDEYLSEIVEEMFVVFQQYREVLNVTFNVVIQKKHIEDALKCVRASMVESEISSEYPKHKDGGHYSKGIRKNRGLTLLQYISDKIAVDQDNALTRT